MCELHSPMWDSSCVVDICTQLLTSYLIACCWLASQCTFVTDFNSNLFEVYVAKLLTSDSISV